MRTKSVSRLSILQRTFTLRWAAIVFGIVATVRIAPYAEGRDDGEIHFRNTAASSPDVATVERTEDVGDQLAGSAKANRKDDETKQPDAALKPLEAKVRRVLDSYYLRPLSTRDESPWSILHWSIAFGVDANVRTPGSATERASAIGWLCVNNPAAGQRLIVDRGDSFSLPVAPGLQGHEGQFLSMLAQSRVKKDYVLRVGNRDLSIADLIEYEKRTCRLNTELTFKLIGLCHYEGTEAAWKNNRGEEWSIAKLLKDELKQPIGAKEATCGGLHRLFSLSYAVEHREKEGEPVTGDWLVARERTERYQRRAFEVQNSDGSFSTAWLDRREKRDDVTRQLTTSGHVLEWLAYSLPDDQLADERFQRAVGFVAGLLDGKEGTAWHRGALSHSLHALSIYEERVLGTWPGDRGERLAKASPNGEQTDSPTIRNFDKHEPRNLEFP